MSRIRYFFATFVALAFVGPLLNAATYDDPSWPCIQRKVEKLSLGIMWPHPVPDGAISGRFEDAARDLITRLSLRRVSLEETGPLIAQFVESHPDADAGLLGKIFAGVFKRLSRDRATIIDGIKKYSFKQIELATNVDATREKMASLLKVADPDHGQIDKLEEKLDWDERIYKDRARSLIYVCEKPVLLEKRLFAISRTLQGYIKE